jgi:alpha-ketoglutarate-dependent taurine dioxygenase
MNPCAVREGLNQNGWCMGAFPQFRHLDLTAQVKMVAETLGEIVPGRGRQLVEQVIPRTAEAAPKGSLSSLYGLRSLPLHTDMAHWPRPCRYLVLACAVEGPSSTPTFLLDSHQVSLSRSEAAACRNAIFLVRNGRRSFYGCISSADRQFIRIDPGCMAPMSEAGNAALDAFGSERQAQVMCQHHWKAGDILIIDNWRVLHGRGNVASTTHGRILLRAAVS